MKNEQNRALGYLRDLVEDSDLSRREVEDRLGWTRGYLSQLLKGRVELRIRHLEVLFAALGVAPADFFGVLFPPSETAGGRRGGAPDLEVGDETVQVACFGIRRIRELARRLERCETALAELARSSALERRVNDAASLVRRAARG